MRPSLASQKPPSVRAAIPSRSKSPVSWSDTPTPPTGMRIGTDMATRGYRLGQIGSASLVSLGHGTNDAQKTMGIIVLALVANGNLSGEDFTVPLWVKVTCATAIALGTFMGGWRIIGTLGKKVTGDITPPQGFSAEASGATLILGSSYFGYPLSTTQVVSGAVVGSGIGRGESRVNWGIAGRMGIAWALTLPGSAAVAAAAYGIVSLFGETAGPVVVGALALLGSVALFLKTRREDSSDQDLNDLKGGAGMILAELVAWGDLVKVVVVGLVGGVGLVVTWGFLLLGLERSKKCARACAPGALVGYGALTLVGGVTTIALLVLGLWAITQK